MKIQTIRKNAINNNWEHYVKETNVSDSYWAPGISGNDNEKNLYEVSSLPRLNKNGTLLSYNFFSYSTEYFNLSDIKKNKTLDFEEIKLIDNSEDYGIPIANINGPYGSSVGILINFSSEGSIAGGESSIIKYEWDFGDGSTSNLSNPTHAYIYPADYTVKLTITNSEEKIDTVEIIASIIEELPAEYYPVAALNGPYSAKSNQSISFNSDNSIAGQGEIIKYEWDFGDGSTSNLANPTHTYILSENTDLKTYQVKLIITNSLNATDDIESYAEIRKDETVLIIVNPNGPYLNDRGNSTVQFSSAGSTINFGSIASYLWDFGDGNTSNVANPFHDYLLSSGIWTVRLTIADALGNSNFKETTVEITSDEGGS